MRLKGIEYRGTVADKMETSLYIVQGPRASQLEQRREKTRALKQAMMQELLTGRTRLIPSGAEHAEAKA